MIYDEHPQGMRAFALCWPFTLNVTHIGPPTTEVPSCHSTEASQYSADNNEKSEQIGDILHL